MGAGIEGVDPAPGDDRLGEEASFVGGAGTDVGAPGARWRIGQIEMVHGMGREAAGLGPVGIDPPPGQLNGATPEFRIGPERAFETEDGDAHAR